MMKTKVDLNLKTGRITSNCISTYVANGYIPIFICRFMNPLVKIYEGTEIHHVNLAPSRELLLMSKNGVIDWNEYKYRYIKELNTDNVANSLNKIYELVKLRDDIKAKGAILLCYCRDYTRCHRSILASIINSMNILNNEVSELYV